MAYGVGTNYGIGERMDPEDFREQVGWDYNADIDGPELVRGQSDLDDELDAESEAVDDE